MYGVVTRNAEELDWPEFDRGVYEVKAASGRETDPQPAGASAVSCFVDGTATRTSPELAAVDGEGRPATSEASEFDVGYVCPTQPAYREGLLEAVADAAGVSEDVRLDDAGFPGAAYCRCDRCERAFEGSDHDDWSAWRTAVVTEFVADAADRVPGRLSLSVHPDPYPGHLRERSGVDLDALAPHVDEVVVPLYASSYAATYWVEALASGFADRVDLPLGIELFSGDVDVANLVGAVEVAEAHADVVYFGFGADAGRAAIRRRRAEGNEGETYQ